MAAMMPFRQDPSVYPPIVGSFIRRGSLEVDTPGYAPTEQSSASSISLSSLSTMTSDDNLTSESDLDAQGEDILDHQHCKTEVMSPISMQQITSTESSPVMASTAKRSRGRPKKALLHRSISTTVKVVKGRSKTGCFTCRRRKKKCDERKPGCLACEKNNVECEGYPRPTVWQSRRHQSEESKSPTTTSLSFMEIPQPLPVIINGIETEIDRMFFDHFAQNFSKVLSIHDEQSNPFNDLLLPLAYQHQGLMHSLMALSGSNYVVQHPEEAFRARKDYHADIAISMLRQDIAEADNGEVNGIVQDPTIASTIVQCLICISDGNTSGEHRMHLSAAANLIPRTNSCNRAFQKFITEFFLYHQLASTITSLDQRPSMTQDASGAVHASLLNPMLDSSCSSAAVIGILDGLYPFISAITTLRDTIRARKQRGIVPTVSHDAVSQALRIDAGIRAWQPLQTPHSPRWNAEQLYRQCSWVYLWRTVQPSCPSTKISQVVDAGLVFLRALPDFDSTQSILLLPVFLLGCAAFDPRQRPDIEAAFETLLAYSHLGNIRPAREIVSRVWQIMDAGDERSWDWETIMAEMGTDFLVT